MFTRLLFFFSSRDEISSVFLTGMISSWDEISSRQKRVNSKRHFTIDRDDFVPERVSYQDERVWTPSKKLFLRNLWENLYWEMIFFTVIFIKFCKKFRSSNQRYSIEKAVLKNFAILTGKHLCWCLFSIKSQDWRPTSVNDCFCKFQISDIPRESCFAFLIKCLNFWSFVVTHAF